MHLSGKSVLTLGYFNAQSVHQKTGEIREFVADGDFDALILTETWLLVAGDEPCLRELTPTDYVTLFLTVDAVEVALVIKKAKANF